MARARRIHVRFTGDIAIISFVDARIDYDQDVRDQLYSLVEDRGCTKLLLDLSNVVHLTSAGASPLVGLHRRVTKARGQLILYCQNRVLI